MRIGLDFDNTIVCYDQAVSILAEELFDLPKDLPRTKRALRNFLRTTGREVEWTNFQGELYGPGMRYAFPFPSVIDSLALLSGYNIELRIISHRTKHPYSGKMYDLHSSATDWLARWIHSSPLLINSVGKSIAPESFFLETKEEKIEKIRISECSYFLDDLNSVTEELKKYGVNAILFDPNKEGANRSSSINSHAVSTWKEFVKYVMDNERLA